MNVMRMYNRVRDTFHVGSMFQAVLAAETINILGSQLSLLAIPTIAILFYHVSPLGVSVLLTLEYLPSIVLGPILGILVDRIVLKRLLVGTDIVSALIIGTIPMFAVFDVHSLLHLYIVGIFLGFFSPLHDLTIQSLMPIMMTDGERLAKGNATLEIGRSVGYICGWGLGGLLIQRIGPQWAIALDSVSFLISASIITIILTPVFRESSPKPKIGREELLKGVKALGQFPILVRFAFGSATLNLGGAALGSLYFLYAYRELHLSATDIGITVVLNYIGSLLGSILVTPIMKRLNPIVIVMIFSAIAGFALFFIPLASIRLSMVSLLWYNFLFGLAGTIWGIAAMTFRQTLVPSNILGRVNATMRAVTIATFPVGSILSGLLANSLGILPTLYGAAAFASTAWLWFVFPVRKTVDHLEEEKDHHESLYGNS